MARKPADIYLERQNYRRRRLIDAVRLVPFLGVILFFLPVLWAGQSQSSAGLLYLFGAWGVLIVIMAALARALVSTIGSEQDDGKADGGD